jgi:hypothetical protein
MMLDTKSWLVSYEYQIVYKTELGMSAGPPVKAVVLLSQHPAVFCAERAAEYHALLAAEYSTTTATKEAELIRTIYSATEVPPGTLTMENVLAYKQFTESE